MAVTSFESTQASLSELVENGTITEQDASQALKDSIASGFTAEFGQQPDGTFSPNTTIAQQDAFGSIFFQNLSNTPAFQQIMRDIASGIITTEAQVRRALIDRRITRADETNQLESIVAFVRSTGQLGSPAPAGEQFTEEQRDDFAFFEGVPFGTSAGTGAGVLATPVQASPMDDIINAFVARQYDANEALRRLLALEVDEAVAKSFLEATGLVVFPRDDLITNPELDGPQPGLVIDQSGNTVADPQGARFGRFSQYLNSLGLGATGGGFGGDFQRDQFDNFSGVFNLANQFQPVIGGNTGSFQDALNRGRTSAGQIRDTAADILRGLYAAGGDRRADQFLRFGVTGFDDVTGAASRDVSQADQRRLIELGLGPQVGALAARYIGRDLERTEDQFALQSSQGTAGATNFLDFLRNKYNLNF